MFLPLPPEAPMAIFSPALKSLALIIVLWTSVSNTQKKHSLQTWSPVLGRLIIARALSQKAQFRGGICGQWQSCHMVNVGASSHSSHCWSRKGDLDLERRGIYILERKHGGWGSRQYGFIKTTYNTQRERRKASLASQASIVQVRCLMEMGRAGMKCSRLKR